MGHPPLDGWPMGACERCVRRHCDSDRVEALFQRGGSESEPG